MTDILATSRYSDGDIDTNQTDNPTLSSMIDQRYSRRQTMMGGISALTMATLGGAVVSACGSDGDRATIPPSASAGGTQTSSGGNAVTLTGSATDADGTISSYAWTQTSGPAVTLTGASTPTASFIAPAVATSTTLGFRLTAMDNQGGMATSDTTVTVDPPKLSFAAVAKNQNDVVTVPEGYTVTVLYRMGDPIAAGVAAYANDGTDTNFAQRAGDQHDALYYYGLAASGTARDDNNSSRGLLVMNHENILPQYMHPAGPTSVGGVRPEAEALKEMEAHGVSVVEVVRASNGTWSYVQDSPLNRRITPLTPMVFNGPVRGNALLRTAFSTDGTQGRGTINNCANGYTPWGTDLTCEENWAFYFRRPTASDNPNRTAKEVTALTRYGVTSGTGNNAWSTVVPANGGTQYARWNAIVQGASATADFRNEPNQFGWVVEIDPYDPASTPRKRTALGRMNHEGAWPSEFVVGRRPAFYTGDDAQNEYLYKFISATPWVAADAQAADRLAIGDKYLDTGTLYVAKFNADGTGTWLPLVFGQGPLTSTNTTYAFADQGDVLTHARIAGDVLGATRMDRPEWTGTNPLNGEIYLTLTNNSSRNGTTNPTDAANPRVYVDPPSTSRGNRNGHIIRLRETGDTSEATTFTWDIYLFGADSADSNASVNLSGLDATNDFSSPDGLWFARPTNASGQVTPVLWIQTDDAAFTDRTNNQMLAAMPGAVGDGGAQTVTNTLAGGAQSTQATIVGAAPGVKLKRFLVGPKECEITGVDSTPDGRTLFVNVQHPGEGSNNPATPSSNWPASQAGSAPATSRPRSATVVITKNDGGVVGL
jgi:secreted PhoX family phosphatase